MTTDHSTAAPRPDPRAERAAETILSRAGVFVPEGVSPLSALGWELGDGAFSYERGMSDLVTEALESAEHDSGLPDVKRLRKRVGDHLMAIEDEHARSLARTDLVFHLFFDDEPSEPDQAIRDALTDLMHSASDRGIDFSEAFSSALRMWTREREDWGLDETEGI